MRTLLCLWAALLLGIPTAVADDKQSPASKIRLLQTVTVAPESEGGGARPEVVATAERVFVVYLGNIARALADRSMGPTFRVKVLSSDLSKVVASKVMVTSTEAYGRPTDIRVASDGKHLYAFYETVLGNNGGFLWGAKYTLDDQFERVAHVGPIATGKFWAQTQEGDELINDPIPLVGPGSVFVITRLKGKSPSRQEHTVYRVREFTTDLKKLAEFDLDLSKVADGEPRQSSALYWRGHFYMVVPTTSEEGSFQVDMATPSDLLMVKLDRKWKVLDSKLISNTPGDVETFVTGFQEHGGQFFITYKQGSPQRGFVSPLKIYDENFNLLLTETVRTPPGRGESLKSSLAVTDRYIYVGYGIGQGPPPPGGPSGRRGPMSGGEGQPTEAVVYVYDRTGSKTADRAAQTYPVVATGQTKCYDNRDEIAPPKPGQPFSGQDAQYAGNSPSYRDNGDGTVSDLVTGLMWQQDPGAKKTYEEAAAGAATCQTGGHADWRLPTIKELYSLILFSGTDPEPNSRSVAGLKPFIDNSVFKFQYGKAEDGDRIIDSQFATSTLYVSTTMGGNKTMFGVNFPDGRIKGYPAQGPRNKKFCVFYVRGNPLYGKNQFKDNGDGTVSDEATGLTWMKTDSGKGLDWPQALAYAENQKLGGHSDWRLPTVKELQSLVDYSRSPDTTDSAAIDSIFHATSITNEGGKKDFAQYWSSTTHVHAGGGGGQSAAYVAFGRSLGWMPDRRTGEYRLLDVHGAGSQRSDPKVGDPVMFPHGRGPQGDVIRIYNYVRLVRGGNVVRRTETASALPPATAPARAEESSGVPGGPGIGGPRQPASPIIAALDSNGDGVIAEDEIKNASAVLKKLDQNGDGKLTSEEIRPPGMSGPGGRFERPGSSPRPAGREPANRPPFDQNNR